MSKTWISVQLETSFVNSDPAVQKFLKEQKPELQVAVAHFIESWLREKIVPYGIVASTVTKEFAAVRGAIEQEARVRQNLKNVPRPIEITENEQELLLAIRDSEYNNDTDRLAPVWVNCLWGFEGKKSFGGVMASLTKKNLAQTDGECAWLTQVGLDRIKDIPYKCTIDRAVEKQGFAARPEGEKK